MGLWSSLLLTEEKGNSVMQSRQYHGKGLLLRFSYIFSYSPIPMQAVCTHFSHKLHITAGSFLAAQFGIWIGMVGHSAEFYFSVSDFVSFSQFHFSYFAYVSKNVFLKTVDSEFGNSWLFSIFCATYIMDHMLHEFTFVHPSFTCDCWGNPSAIFIICLMFPRLSEVRDQHFIVYSPLHKTFQFIKDIHERAVLDRYYEKRGVEININI